jgi:hypothetical protein
MKKLLLLLIMLCFFSNCKKESIEKKAIVITKPPIENIQKNKNSKDKMLDHLIQKYSTVYQFKESEDDNMEESTQLLGITYLKNNSIDFYLYTETSPCDTEYFGKAFQNKNDTINSEEKDDLNRIFIKEEKEYKLSIILNQEKNQASIEYIQKDSLGTDCLPITQVLMNLAK